MSALWLLSMIFFMHALTTWCRINKLHREEGKILTGWLSLPCTGGLKWIWMLNSFIERILFHKVMGQQIWGAVIVLIQAFSYSTDPFWTWQSKIMKICSLLPKLWKAFDMCFSNLLLVWVQNSVWYVFMYCFTFVFYSVLFSSCFYSCCVLHLIAK